MFQILLLIFLAIYKSSQLQNLSPIENLELQNLENDLNSIDGDFSKIQNPTEFAQKLMNRQELIFKSKNRTAMENSMHENFEYYACANVVLDRENAIEGLLEDPRTRHRVLKNGRILTENIFVGEVDFRQMEKIGNSSDFQEIVHPVEYYWIHSKDFGFVTYFAKVLDCKTNGN